MDRGLMYHVCGVVVSLLITTPSTARSWPSVGWFDIVQADNGCGAAAEYSFDGRPDVKLLISLDMNGDAILSLTSLGWSSEEKKVYDDIEWHVNNEVYTGKTVGVIHDYIYRGFVAKFGPDFVSDFSVGASLYVTRGDVVVTHINLLGSGRAIAVLRQCVAFVRNEVQAKRQREGRWDYIEKDPFSAGVSKREKAEDKKD